VVSITNVFTELMPGPFSSVYETREQLAGSFAVTHRSPSLNSSDHSRTKYGANFYRHIPGQNHFTVSRSGLSWISLGTPLLSGR